MRPALPIALLSALAACSGDGAAGKPDGAAADPADGATGEPGAADAAPARDPDAGDGCPAGMAPVGDACMDRYEAPNIEGALPLVMYTFDEAADWCAARDKRLCFDDEWQTACEGAAAAHYPYGDDHEPGTCNDDKLWRAYNQSLLNGWPWNVPTDDIENLATLLDEVRAMSSGAAAAAEHVEALYQGEAAGANPGCVNEYQVYDLVGNVEEWTRRRDGGAPQFHGNLKGRYWAEARTCQSGVKVHGDAFRFYEIGFRCCSDRDQP